jgi:hypothetical protein
MVSMTIFKNLYDNKTDKSMEFDDFNQLSSFLYRLSTIEYINKRDASLMSPATFLSGMTRANKSVVDWAGWAAVDVDDHVFEGDLESELKSLYGKYSYVCYSTASSSNEHPKFRLVFPLTHSVKADKIKHFWFALNAELGDIGDPQTKDLSRMYFVPGTYEGANNFIFGNDGEYVNPYDIMDRHEYAEPSTGNSFLDSLPEEVKKQILDHRKTQMTNTNVTWSDYRDCPFVNKRLIFEYKTIDDSGWYRKMYQIMVSISVNALRKRYPITAVEVAELCRQIDSDNGSWYNNRPLEREARGAINFAYENVDFNQ